MQKILIDINHNTVDIQNVIQGIKLYQNKSKSCQLIVVGKEDDMLTLKGLDGIDTIYASKVYSSKEDILDPEVSLTKCFTLLSDNKYKFDALISSAPCEVLKAYSEKYLNKLTDSPAFVSEFPNAFTGRKSAIMDVGYNLHPTGKDLVEFERLGEIYTKKALYSNNFTFKLLTGVKSPELDTKENMEADEAFKALKSYKGKLAIADVFAPDTKLIVGDTSTIQTMIQSTTVMYDLYENYVTKSIKDDFKVKIGSKLMKSTFRDIHRSLDKKFTSGGSVLLGYDANIVQANPTTTCTGFDSTIILAKTIIRCNLQDAITRRNDKVN